jgi:transporter family-2 protein
MRFHSVTALCRNYARKQKHLGQILTVLAVLVGGIGLSLQAAMNTRLKTEAGSPVMSALISFVVGGIALVLLVAFGVWGKGRIPAPHSVPAWAWVGGLMGAFYVTIVVVALPRIGQTLLVGATVLGQLSAALVLDTLGWLGVPRLPLHPVRLIGALFLLIGVILMAQRK